MVVVEGTHATCNIPYVISDHISHHQHEEADTLIPLHVKDIIESHNGAHIDVWSPDTDVLLLLMHLVSVDNIRLPNKVNMITGKGQHRRSINIVDRVFAIRSKSQRVSLVFITSVERIGVANGLEFQRRHG